MPRPVKRRRVCEPPRNARFGPLDGAPAENVVLAVDEYETIRLIDLLGLTQEECAGQMGVARTTVQALYEAARAKLADMLVNGRLLHVEGGPYELCPRAGGCRGKRCAQSAGGSAFCARYQTISEDANMKIAVTYENGWYSSISATRSNSSCTRWRTARSLPARSWTQTAAATGRWRCFSKRTAWTR